jgi:hypothetical protein
MAADDYITEDVIDELLQTVGVEDGSGCWLWNGSRNNSGYANFSIPNVGKIGAHRLMYRLFNGDISGGLIGGLYMLHLCNNGHRGCVNPAHLMAGTASLNAQHRILAGHGTKQKLRPHDVTRIRSLYFQGKKLIRDIAAEYKMSETSIRQIISRRKWGWYN